MLFILYAIGADSYESNGDLPLTIVGAPSEDAIEDVCYRINKTIAYNHENGWDDWPTRTLEAAASLGLTERDLNVISGEGYADRPLAYMRSQVHQLIG